MILKTHGNETILVYNSNQEIGNRAKNYAKQEGIIVKSYDIAQKSLTSTQWLEIASALGGIKNLVDTEHEGFNEKYPGAHDFSELDWVRILEHSPEMLDQPIGIKDGRARKIYAPSELAHV